MIVVLSIFCVAKQCRWFQSMTSLVLCYTLSMSFPLFFMGNLVAAAYEPSRFPLLLDCIVHRHFNNLFLCLIFGDVSNLAECIYSVFVDAKVSITTSTKSRCVDGTHLACTPFERLFLEFSSHLIGNIGSGKQTDPQTRFNAFRSECLLLCILLSLPSRSDALADDMSKFLYCVNNAAPRPSLLYG